MGTLLMLLAALLGVLVGTILATSLARLNVSEDSGRRDARTGDRSGGGV
ncbi:hypothetical protein PSH03_000379 [Micromonospora sp. PSH03]|nr:MULTISPECIES: hypothetical protein [Micromonospora]MBQ0990240.1 hypothetical protein [Micromonospora sp. H61]MCG5455503.1 hypothetical protein [Micromonospora salmantinae]